MDWNSLSNSVIVLEIGKRLKEYRLKKRLSQYELAEQAGVSLFTVAKIEKGKPVSINVLLPVMRVLRLLDNFEFLLPEIGLSPIEIMKLQTKKPQRIRTKKRTDGNNIER
jgi:transcriptional regulator with XRE-family HTH domain